MIIVLQRSPKTRILQKIEMCNEVCNEVFTKTHIFCYYSLLIFIAWADFSDKLNKIEKNTRIEKKE